MSALDSLSAFGSILLQVAESRLQLFSLEYRQEKARICILVGLACLASSTLVLAGASGVIALTLAVPEDYRPLVLSLIAATFLIVFTCCAFGIAYQLNAKRAPFNATREELRKDAACLSDLVKKKE